MLNTLPTLANDEKMALMALFTRCVYHPQFAAYLYVNPNPFFLDYRLSDPQISQILTYLRGIFEPLAQAVEGQFDLMEMSAQFPDESQMPYLSFHEKQVILQLAEQALNDPELAIRLITTPLAVLKQTALNADEIAEVSAYAFTIFNLIKRYFTQNWY